MADSDNCVICLEPLLVPTGGCSIGAAVPCGHCFHEECFRSWEASRLLQSQSSSRRQKLPCPTCNTVTKSFCKIFIRGTSAGDDNDSVSSSSSSSASSMGTTTGQPQAVDDNVVDLTDSPLLLPAVKRKARVVSNDDKKCKRYKKQYKACRSICQDLRQQQRQWQQDQADFQKELDENKSKWQQLQERYDQESVQRNELNLQVLQLQRQVKKAEHDKIVALEQKEKAIQKCQQIQSRHAHDLQKVRTENLHHVQKIAKEHPQLAHQNQTLQERLRHQEEHIQHLERQVLFLRKDKKQPSSCEPNNMDSLQDKQTAPKAQQIIPPTASAHATRVAKAAAVMPSRKKTNLDDILQKKESSLKINVSRRPRTMKSLKPFRNPMMRSRKS